MHHISCKPQGLVESLLLLPRGRFGRLLGRDLWVEQDEYLPLKVLWKRVEYFAEVINEVNSEEEIEARSGVFSD